MNFEHSSQRVGRGGPAGDRGPVKCAIAALYHALRVATTLRTIKFCACQKLSRESKSKNRAWPVGRNTPVDRQTPEIAVGSLHRLVRIRTLGPGSARG